MARHLFLAATLICVAGLLNSPAQALWPIRCDDLAARCTLCPTPGGGVFPANMHGGLRPQGDRDEVIE
jgi:hypothetical protein